MAQSSCHSYGASIIRHEATVPINEGDVGVSHSFRAAGLEPSSARIYGANGNAMKLRTLFLLCGAVCLFSFLKMGDIRGSRHDLNNDLKMGAFVLLCMGCLTLPGCILVAFSDQRRQEIEKLGHQRDLGLLAQRELKLKRQEIISRSYWHQEILNQPPDPTPGSGTPPAEQEPCPS